MAAAAHPKPAVSVVVPTLDAGPMLFECLERIDPCRPEVELIIVDNGSTDGSVDKAAERFPLARIIANDFNQGYAQACNQGAAVATGEFVLFLNNDAFMSPENLDVLLTAARGDPAGAVWQPVNEHPDGIVEFSGDCFTWWGFFLHLHDRPCGPALRTVFAAKAACLLVRRGVFESLGGFNGDYFAYFEESDFCWRVRLASWEVRVVPDAHVEHIGGVTTSRLLSPDEVRYLAFRNRIRTILACASAGSLARILPRHLLGSLAFAAVFAATGRLRSVSAILSALFWPLRHAGAVRAQRRRTQSVRRVDDRSVLRNDLITEVRPAIVWRHLRHQFYRWENARTKAIRVGV